MQCYSAVYMLMTKCIADLQAWRSLTAQSLALWGSSHVPPGYSSKMHCADFISSKGFRIDHWQPLCELSGGGVESQIVVVSSE